ncbi:hypothetical protein D1AOALGA4SA_3143 [Olavius algarvensis Delta 1 endosymbiont]|nr:hypothetical protein D1AOALGA4SA_3143 [Olavius algarvensis Delta 1 endosymbiont]
MAGGCSTFISFISLIRLDAGGQRPRSYETMNVECRLTNGGFASLSQ